MDLVIVRHGHADQIGVGEFGTGQRSLLENGVMRTACVLRGILFGVPEALIIALAIAFGGGCIFGAGRIIGVWINSYRSLWGASPTEDEPNGRSALLEQLVGDEHNDAAETRNDAAASSGPYVVVIDGPNANGPDVTALRARDDGALVDTQAAVCRRFDVAILEPQPTVRNVPQAVPAAIPERIALGCPPVVGPMHLRFLRQAPLAVMPEIAVPRYGRSEPIVMGERNGAAETGSDVAVLTDQSAIVVGDPVRRFSDGAALPSLTANVPPAAPAIIPVRRVLGHLPAAAPMDLQFSPQAPSASMPKAVTVVPEVAVASRERCDGHATSGPAAVCDPVAGRSGWRLQIGGVGRGDSRVDDVFRQNDFFAALDYSDDPVSCAARSFVGRGDFVRIFPDGRSAPELLRDVGKWLDVWSGEVFGRNIFIAIPKGWLIPSTNGRLDVIVSLLIIASTTVGVRAMVIFPGVGSFFRKNSAKVTRKAIASGLAHLALLGQRPVDRVTLLECDQDFARRVVDGLDGECDLAMSCISLP